MKPRSARNNLVIVAAEFVNHELGRKFLAAFELYAEEAREQCVFAPKENLDYAQGVARQSTVLLRLLKSSPEDAVKILNSEAAESKKG